MRLGIFQIWVVDCEKERKTNGSLLVIWIGFGFGANANFGSDVHGMRNEGKDS